MPAYDILTLIPNSPGAGQGVVRVPGSSDSYSLPRSAAWTGSKGTFTLGPRNDSGLSGAAADYGVPTFRALVANQPTALDIFPNGTGGSDPTGLAWLHVLKQDLSTAADPTEWQAAVVAARSDSISMGSMAGGSMSVMPLVLGGETITLRSRVAGVSGTDFALFNSAGALFLSGQTWLTADNFRMKSGFDLRWMSSSGDVYGTADVILARDAAAILALRNGANGQIFRAYNTFTDASNFERVTFGWSGNVCTIGTQAGGTGTARSLNLVAANGFIVCDGNVVGPAANTRDIGSSGTTWRNSFFAGYHQLVETTAPASPSTNQVRIYAEDNGSGKTRLMALFATGAAQQIAIEP